MLVRPSISDDRARLDDPGEIEELVALAERLFAAAFGRALKDGDAVADSFDHLRASRGELLGRENLVPAKYGLRREERSKASNEDSQRQGAMHGHL